MKCAVSGTENYILIIPIPSTLLNIGSHYCNDMCSIVFDRLFEYKLTRGDWLVLLKVKYDITDWITGTHMLVWPQQYKNLRALC